MPRADQLVAQSPATIDALSGVLYPVFNIVRYGAVGNDVADDTAAIQAAVDACKAAGGGIVMFPTPSVAWRLHSSVQVSGATQTDGFDAGGVALVGVSQRGVKVHVVGGITGFLYPSGSRMMCPIENMEIYGDGKATASSRGIFWNGTGGNTNFRNVYVHDLEIGVEWYDATLSVWMNCAVRKCATGIKTGYNHDIHTYLGCRFDYNDTAVQIGSDTGGATESLNYNFPVRFIGCRISNNTVRAISVRDRYANLHFDNCYFESNPKEADIGVSGRTDGTGPVVTFTDCFFTPVTTAPVAVGLEVYNPAIVTVERCSTDGDSRYTLFARMNDLKGIYRQRGMSRIRAATADAVHGGKNYLSTLENREDICVGAGASEINMTDAGYNFPASNVWRIHGLSNGTGKTWDAWRRINGSTGATLAEIQVYDSGGVMRLAGVGSAPGYICATSISALPTAGVNYRGALAYVPGNGTTTADQLYTCLMSSTGTYSWKSIVTG